VVLTNVNFIGIWCRGTRRGRSELRRGRRGFGCDAVSRGHMVGRKEGTGSSDGANSLCQSCRSWLHKGNHTG
jgi:hypothetical protein